MFQSVVSNYYDSAKLQTVNYKTSSCLHQATFASTHRVIMLSALASSGSTSKQQSTNMKATFNYACTEMCISKCKMRCQNKYIMLKHHIVDLF